MKGKRILYILVISLPFVVFVCNNKSVTSTAEDIQYIEAFFSNWKITSTIDSIHSSFEIEIQFIQRLQDSVISDVEHSEIPHKYFGQVAYYYNNRKGFCYDRSVLMEKMLDYYGFPFRHAYLSLAPEGKKASFFRLLKKGVPSHALFEVKTAKGWMAVGSNVKWIGLSSHNEALTIEDVRERLRKGTLDLKYKFDDTHVFWKEKGSDFIIIYGLYSRHGEFFDYSNSAKASLLPSFGLLPDYNIRMLLYNF